MKKNHSEMLVFPVRDSLEQIFLDWSCQGRNQ